MNTEIEKKGFPYAFRYRPNNEKTLDELENSYIYFSDQKSLNDPFDSSPILLQVTDKKEEFEKIFEKIYNSLPDNFTKEYLKKNFTSESLKDLIHNSIEPYVARFGIACFSYIPYNMLLWGNYAGNHKGICLQYNVQKDLEYFSGMRPVKYVENLEKIEFSPLSSHDNLIELFYRKHIYWDKELEIRLVKEKKGKLRFNKSALKNIILGYKVEDDFKNEIIKIVKIKYPDTGLYQVKNFTDTKTLNLKFLL